jgi:hypothetical protein
VTSTYQTEVEEESEMADQSGQEEEPKQAPHVEKDEDYMPK